MNPYSQQNLMKQVGMNPQQAAQNAQVSNGLPPQLMQNIQNVKNVMQLMRGNPAALMQQCPQLGQVMQMARGQNLQQMFMGMCQQRGVDPNAILNALQS